MNGLSIIVCTCNRSGLLPGLVKAFDTAVVMPVDLQMELLFVDSNSTDDTRSTIMSIMPEKHQCDIRYVHEKQSGLSNARNTGIQTARYDMIGFVDDDIIPHTDYLQKVMSAMIAHPEIQCFTNKIVLRTPGKPPWLAVEGKYATVDRGGYDLGCTKTLDDRDPPPIGASMFFHKNIFTRFGVFDTGFGYDFSRPDMVVPGEESLLFEKIRRECPVMYVHEAIAYHSPVQQKYDLGFLRRFYKGIGFWYGSVDARNIGHKNMRIIAGYPGAYYKRYFLSLLSLIVTSFSLNKTVRYFYRLKWEESCGYFRGFTAYRKRNDKLHA